MESKLTDRFRSDVKRGDNLSVLRKGSRFFATKGLSIVRYYFSTDRASRNKSVLGEEDLKECEVCGKRLYEMDEESRYTRSNDIKVVQKKYLLFVDSGGNIHPTCYGLNWCFKHVNFNNRKNRKGKDFKCPNLKELATPEINLGELEDAVLEAANMAYNKNVAPFLQKWVHLPMSKENVFEFISDVKTVESKFLSLYCQSKTEIDLLKQKIFTIIGVRYEK